MAAGYNPAFMNGQNGHDGRMAPPFSSGPLHGQHPHQHPHPPPPQWSGEHMMYPPLHPQMVYGGHPPPHMYYQQQPHYPMHAHMTPDHSADMHLAPAAEVNGAGLPTSNADIYHDEYGHAHPVHVAPKMDEDAEPPAKRQKSDDSQIIEESDEDDEIPDAPPLPHQMILSTKPSRPKPSSHTARSKLLGPVDAFDIDMIIDEHGHTALHWAASLAKMDIVKQLIELGADIHRGNFNGETPLARALLTTNNAETGTVSVLLEHLAPSIQTLDQSYRSVAHHVSLVSGIPGRASCARLYMAAILEWVAKEQRTSASLAQGQGHDGTNGTTGTSAALSLKALVDVQDLYGDTALNVAARMGTRGLVRLLLDAGADKSKGNKLGLRPVDFGVEPEVSRSPDAWSETDQRHWHCRKPRR
jgi:regulatory protein SWI6